MTDKEAIELATKYTEALLESFRSIQRQAQEQMAEKLRKDFAKEKNA